MDTLKVGIGRTDITPALGVRLGGYGTKERPAENVIDHLNATALHLESDGAKAIILNLDWICVDEEDAEAIRRAACAATGVKPSHITVCGTHSHSVPNTLSAWGWGDKERGYIAAVIPKIAEAAALAAANSKPAKAGVATTHCEAGVNRRLITKEHGFNFGGDPMGSFDPTMTVVRFVGETGPLGVLVHYGAHGTAMGNTRDVSRDWMGVMADRVEQQLKAPVVFVNGAIGDVGPRTSHILADGCFSAGVGDGRMAVLEVGLCAAADALRAHQAIKGMRGDWPLELLTDDIALPYAPLAPLAEAEAYVKTHEADKDVFGGKMCEYRYHEAVVAAHARPLLTGRKFSQTITRLGPIVLIPFPGELFSSISLRLRRHSPFQHTLCSSVSNGSLGYLVAREARHRGGYEPWVGKAYSPYLLAENIDDALVDEHLRLLNRLNS